MIKCIYISLRTPLTCLLIALLCGLAPGCRKKDKHDADEPQPLAPVSAAFKSMIQVYPAASTDPSYLLEVDTLVGPARVFLESLSHMDDSVAWQIGTEANRRKGRSISVLFDDPYEGYVDITCFAYRRNCVSDSTKACSDSLTKKILILPNVQHINYNYSHTFLGRYVGSSTQFPGQEYEIVLGVDSAQGMAKDLYIQNLLPSCSNRVQVSSAMVNQFYILPITDSQGQGRRCLLALYDQENKLVSPFGAYDPHTGNIQIKYWASSNPDVFRNGDRFIFNGTRVP